MLMHGKNRCSVGQSEQESKKTPNSQVDKIRCQKKRGGRFKKDSERLVRSRKRFFSVAGASVGPKEGPRKVKL